MPSILTMNEIATRLYISAFFCFDKAPQHLIWSLLLAKGSICNFVEENSIFLVVGAVKDLQFKRRMYLFLKYVFQNFGKWAPIYE